MLTEAPKGDVYKRQIYATSFPVVKTACYCSEYTLIKVRISLVKRFKKLFYFLPFCRAVGRTRIFYNYTAKAVGIAFCLIFRYINERTDRIQFFLFQKADG